MCDILLKSVGGVGAILLFLAGCATQVPPAIRAAPANDVGIGEVLAGPGDFSARSVRWGGTILTVENRQNETRVTLLGLPLGSDGEPRAGSASPGRFIAVINTFLDPVVYAQNRKLTVSGKVSGSEQQKVGEFNYNYPLVTADEYYLWPEVLNNRDDDYPYGWYDPWYGPWYDPWYPYYPRRYY